VVFTIPGPAVSARIAVTTADGATQSAVNLVVTTPLQPDVAVTGVVAPAMAVRSTKTAVRTMSVTTTVTNSGPKAAGAFAVAVVAMPFSDEGEVRVLGTRAVAGLAPGVASTAATTVTVPADLSRGIYTIGAVADAGGVLSELSLENNPLEASTTTSILDNIVGALPLRPDLSTLTFDNCGSVIGDRSFGGTISISSQTNSQFTGTTTMSSPGSPAVTIKAVTLQGVLDVNGQVTTAPMAITLTAGSTVPGTMTVTGSEADGVLALDISGEATVGGGTCTFTGQVVASPAARTLLNFQLAAPPASFAIDALAPTVTFPVTVSGWQARFKVDFDSPLEGETTLPAPSTVLFTSPSGAVLDHVPANDEESDVGATSAAYGSPLVGPLFGNGSVKTPPGGAWTVSYKGSDRAFTAADPQAATRLVIPVPTATVDEDGVLTRITWVYRNATTGALLSAPPTFMSNIQGELQHDGETGYASGPLPSATRTIPVLGDVPWDCVSTVQMSYDDTLGNRYFVMFDREASGTDCDDDGDSQPPFALAFNFTQGYFDGSTSGSSGIVDFP
jgi:hypothetical protein